MTEQHEKGQHHPGAPLHRHGPGCGHREIRHGDHADYLHDGHLEAADGSAAVGHTLAVDRRRPGCCAPIECPGGHEAGAERVPHGDHEDFAVGGVLHHVHGDHCDLHGKL